MFRNQHVPRQYDEDRSRRMVQYEKRLQPACNADGQMDKSRQEKARGVTKSLGKTRSDAIRLSCSDVSHGGGQWFESTSAHQLYGLLIVDG
jgi:hypothetical protein